MADRRKAAPPAGRPDLGFREFLWIWNRTQGLDTPRHHLRIARWLATRWRGPGREALLMAFRSSGKSTVVGLFCAWVLWRRPQTRILVMAADHALAKKMVRNVKRIIERHPLTPGLVPRRRDQWAADLFTVERPGEARDPSMLAKGIGANVTGSRADIIICDDVEVPNTCATAPRRADLRARLRELDFVLVPGGMQLYVGTPHTYYTIYAAEPRLEAGEEVPFLDGFRRLEIPLIDRAGLSAWPERFPAAALEALRRRSGPARFASQMQLRPVNATEGRLDPDRLRLYDGEIVLASANRLPMLTIGGRRMVSASCCWDPAWGAASGGRGDGSVIAVVFSDADGGYWLHRVRWLHAQADGEADSDEATAQCQQVAAFLAEHHLPAVRVEVNGLGRFLPGLLRRELARAGVTASVLETVSTRPKADRIIEAFDAVLAAGALHAHRTVWDTPFIAEMRDWRPLRAARGRGGHDDGLDAVAACLLAEPVRIASPMGGASSPPGVAPGWRGGGGWDADTDFHP